MKYFSYRSPDGDAAKNAEISVVGFGGMRFPRNEDNSINESVGEALVDRAYAAGINYYDTAYIYHDGKGEGFLSDCLKKYPRESYYLSDKLPVWRLEKEEDVEEYFNEQLRRCGVEHFDFYLCHALTSGRVDKLERFGVIETLEKFKAEGKIKRLGFSFHDTPAVLERILKMHKWDFGQIQYNYLDYKMQNAEELEGLLVKYNTPYLIMEPVRGGALVNVPDKAKDILNGLGSGSVPSYALRFAMSAKNVFCVLSGMTTFEALNDNIATAESFVPVSDEERKALQDVADIIVAARLLPCTACRYCDGCPVGIDIPEVLKLYNEFMSTENKKALREAVGKLENKPSDCIACGACSSACPQRLDIAATMKKLADLTK